MASGVQQVSVVRYDAGAWPEKAEVTPEGFLRVDAPITRMGVLHYSNPDGSPRGELRHPDDWGSAATLATFGSKPLTNGHPPPRKSDGQALVDAKNAKQLAVGWTGESVRAEGAILRAPMTIMDDAAVAAVKAGKRGTSTGVVVDLRDEKGVYDGVAYQYRQINPHLNHIAIVDSPRAGTMIRLDGNQASDESPEGETNMVKVTLDGISYDAAPEVANALTKAQGGLGELTTKLEATIAAGKAALDKAQAERDTYKERLDAAEKRDIRSEVRARVALLTAAAAALPKEQHAKLDELSDDEIRRAVIAATIPTFKLDERTPADIIVAYDIAMANQAQKAKTDEQHAEALGAQRGVIVPRQDSASAVDDNTARIEWRLANQWKPNFDPEGYRSQKA